MTDEKETMMEDWQYKKLAPEVCKRKESIPEILKAAGINKTEIMLLTKAEATTLHYYLHPELSRKGKGGSYGGINIPSEITLNIVHSYKTPECTVCEYRKKAEAQK